jgi:ABC-type cobalamin transport system ATPase subunit
MAAYVGRQREIGDVKRLLDMAQSGAGGVLVVVGPPGAGKSALLDMVAAWGQGVQRYARVVGLHR